MLGSDHRSAVGGRKILVVDDNVDLAEALAEWLEQMGHVVRIAHDGLAALRILDDFIPDLAVLDIGLPVVDGYDLACRIRERPELPNLLLVAMSGNGEEAHRETSRQAGFVAHLVKPVDPDRWRALVEEHTAGQSRPR